MERMQRRGGVRESIMWGTEYVRNVRPPENAAWYPPLHVIATEHPDMTFKHDFPGNKLHVIS